MSRTKPKRFIVKVYDKAGTTYKGTLGELSRYTVSKNINGGLGALKISLPMPFVEDIIIDDLDEVQIYVSDRDTDSKRLYSGYVSKQVRKITGHKESIELYILGYNTRLGMALDIAVDNPVVSRRDIDPADAVKDIIDDYRVAVADERINYTSTSVEDCGYETDYDSSFMYYIESISKWRELAGENWWFFVNADNEFHFKSKPTSATHLFTYGKEVEEITHSRDTDGVISRIMFTNGLQEDDPRMLSRLYYDSTIIGNYWKRDEKANEGKIDTEGGADLYAKALIDANSEPNIYIDFKVKDNNYNPDGQGYDTESIEIGDTCRILNLPDTFELSENMHITGIQYSPEETRVRVGDLRSETSVSLTNIKRALNSEVYNDGLATLTLVDASAL